MRGSPPSPGLGGLPRHGARPADGATAPAGPVRGGARIPQEKEKPAVRGSPPNPGLGGLPRRGQPCAAGGVW